MLVGMKKLALAAIASFVALGSLAAPAAACPGHDSDTPKTAEKDQAPKTADKAKEQKPDLKKADDSKKTDDAKKTEAKKPDKVSQR